MNIFPILLESKWCILFHMEKCNPLVLAVGSDVKKHNEEMLIVQNKMRAELESVSYKMTHK